MVEILDYVEKRKEVIKKEVSTFNRKPKLSVIQIGDDKASSSYVKSKKKLCEEIGIIFEHVHIKDYENISTQDIMVEIFKANTNSDGVILQLPIPDKYDVEKLQKYISLETDVDGFLTDSIFTPCTPKGILDWLDYNKYNLEGKYVTVIGRSKIVGKPLVNLLIDRGATVTCCNSKTKDLRKHTCNADVVVSAVGEAKFLDSSYFTNTELVIDVGINRNENGKLCGDVDYQDVTSKLENIYVTPTPNGTGRLTTLSLIENTIEAYKMKTVLAHCQMEK
jgi:methylenetetrahydrofolate dehydrogenase (NADP+)/methenyltetrahydrofolate cyclohydrolase